jgi:ribosomal protein S19
VRQKIVTKILKIKKIQKTNLEKKKIVIKIEKRKSEINPNYLKKLTNK